ncbi:MAG: Na/Pi symporter [Sedimentisphaerales bacterium]|nr:Na/Pi symporter [Sedimentisphaerales bacterium]
MAKPVKSTLNILSKVLLVAGLLYCFLVSIGLMGAAFKGFGKGFAEQLIKTTSNPFIGLFIGILATSVVQSSSTTTSIVVGMVGSGVLKVSCAIPIIMGANIGTTVTNTLVSLGHVSRRDEFKRAMAAATVHDFFNLICVAVMFPLELTTGYLEKTATLMSSLFKDVGGVKFSSPIKIATEPVIHIIQNSINWICKSISSSTLFASVIVLILSFIILFFSLYFLVRTMRSLVVKRAEIILDNVISRHAFLGFLAGLCFTIVVQSSSVTTSLLVPLVAAGILTVETAFPITIGANIGTTSTGILASFATGNISAIVIAFAHFLFNLTGAVLIYPIKYCRIVPIHLAKSLGNLAAEKRRYAVAYVLGVFFIIPTLLILLSKLF